MRYNANFDTAAPPMALPHNTHRLAAHPGPARRARCLIGTLAGLALTSLATAKYDYLTARLQLEQVAGTLDEGRLQIVNAAIRH